MTMLHQMTAFEDELTKHSAGVLRAAAKVLKRQAGAAGSGLGTGGALGALAGAGGGAFQGHQEASQAGLQGADKALHMLGRGARGAAQGGVVGAVAGAGAGLAGGSSARSLSRDLLSRDTVGMPARFAQRQVHSLTGYADKAGLKNMRAGAETARRRLQSLGGSLDSADAGKSSLVQKAVGKVTGAAPKTSRDSAMKEIGRASKGLQAAQDAEAAGLTSLPGALKGLTGGASLKGKRLSPLQAAKTMVGEQWHGSGPVGKAMMVGFPASAALSPPQEAVPGGPSQAGRGEQIGRALGSGLGYASPLGIAGMSALSAGLGSAGGVVGAGADKLLKRHRTLKGAAV